MVEIIISSIIIILIMILFIFIILKNIVKRINQNAKKYFVNKLEDYNYIVEEKEKQIAELTEEIKLLKKNKEEFEEYKRAIIPRKKREAAKPAINLRVPKYREENFFVNYKELKQKFDFDKEDLIKKFIQEHQDKKHEKDYKTLLNFKNKFNKEAIYQLMTLPGEEQIDIIKSIITDKEKALIDIDNFTEDKNKFNIMELFKKVDEIILEVNPTINVYVSKYDKNYDYIDPYIKTKQYANMSEGIIIEYKGKKYDFSI